MRWLISEYFALLFRLSFRYIIDHRWRSLLAVTTNGWPTLIPYLIICGDWAQQWGYFLEKVPRIFRQVLKWQFFCEIELFRVCIPISIDFEIALGLHFWWKKLHITYYNISGWLLRDSFITLVRFTTLYCRKLSVTGWPFHIWPIFVVTLYKKSFLVIENQKGKLHCNSIHVLCLIL